MDFRQFMCKIEGKPTPPSIPNDDPLILVVGVRLINPDYCQSVLDGEYGDLDYAFNWQSTPQGHRYWDERRNDSANITPTDLLFIRRVMERGEIMRDEAAEDDYDSDF